MLNLNQLKNLYIKSPRWVKKLYAAIPFEIREGSGYRKWCAFLKKELDIEEYETLKIKETVLYAYENTKYYKNLFDQHSINPYEINSRKDLQTIPLLTKKLVKENFHNLQNSNYPNNKKFFISTGGTTGTPMTFYQSKSVWEKEVGFGIYDFALYGYNPSKLKASFRGGTLKNIAKGEYWENDYINNAIHFSPLHLNKNTVAKYVEKLNDARPLFFHAYPSMLIFLIDNMIEQNLRLEYQIKVIFLVSEGYEKKDIKKMKEFFNATLVGLYGHSERTIIARSITQELDIYQVDQRYGCFELIDNNKTQIIQNNVTGTIVGTGFDNYAMPLIRYETDDLTHYVDYQSDKIYMIDSLRNQVYIDCKNCIKISINTFVIAKVAQNIHLWQLYQAYPGKVEVLIVPKKSFTDEDKKQILLYLDKEFGEILDFELKLIDQPMLTKRGKVSKMNRMEST